MYKLKCKNKWIKVLEIAQTSHLKEKMCIYLARGPSLANVIKKIVLKIYTYFIFGHWQGAGWNSKFA